MRLWRENNDHYYQAPYDQQVVDLLRVLPGCRYTPGKGKGVWKVPPDFLVLVAEQPAFEHSVLAIPGLRDYQSDCVSRVLQQRKLLIAHEMRLGKTRTAVTALRLACIEKPTLIVAPAIAHQVWFDELEMQNLRGEVIKTQIGAADLDESRDDICCVITPQLLPWVELPNDGYGALIVDEIHHYVDSRSSYVKKLYETRRSLPSDGLCLVLSGTPISSEPIALRTALEILWPGAFSPWYKYGRRYCETVEGYEGREVYEGINEDNRAELQQRLGFYAHIVTRASLGLKSDIQVEKIADEDVDRWVKHAQRPAVMFVYHRETAEQYAQKYNAICCHGEQPATKRRKAALDAAEQGKLLVATMSSLGEGISLAEFCSALIAEPYASQSLLSQAAARLSTFGGEEKRIVHVCRSVLSSRLRRRLRDDNELGLSPSHATELHGAVEKDRANDESEMLAEISRLLNQGEVEL